ncbi:DJ-1/PfpI family protein [Halosimplex litoreum]|uniref:DJ-1/PfpI family protein n=1 Tax=Halosimplex litoreum TaxID=1198301 RepID=A0A7T3FVS7_9EURY|nr:DJ-1/PfpI family protein [Halosimplex litoreum]QPV61666.1 DJ-1/PfpI family protein [Halosimplex litoreum]
MTDTDSLAILAFEGFEELDAIGPYEVFQGARSAGADWTVELLATAETDRVSAAYDLRVEPDGVLSADADLDYLVVPGGGWNDGDGETGARAVARDETILDAIRALHAEGTTLLSVCTGAMVLSAAGLLDGRPAVTHRSALDELRGTDAEVVDARVVDDSDIVTAGGITAGIDAALWLVEREWGAGVATAVAETTEYERSADVYRA